MLDASKRSPLLELLNTRYANEIKYLPDTYQVPEQDPQRIEMAVVEYVKWNESDPFAEHRIRLYLKRGYELASDVYRDYHRRNLVREMNRRKKRQEKE